MYYIIKLVTRDFSIAYPNNSFFNKIVSTSISASDTPLFNAQQVFQVYSKKKSNIDEVLRACNFYQYYSTKKKFRRKYFTPKEIKLILWLYQCNFLNYQRYRILLVRSFSCAIKDNDIVEIFIYIRLYLHKQTR